MKHTKKHIKICKYFLGENEKIQQIMFSSFGAGTLRQYREMHGNVTGRASTKRRAVMAAKLANWQIGDIIQQA